MSWQAFGLSHLVTQLLPLGTEGNTALSRLSGLCLALAPVWRLVCSSDGEDVVRVILRIVRKTGQA